MSKGGQIATPALSPATVGMQQQPEIAAFHQAEAVPDQADRAIAKIVRLPGAAREAAKGEEDFCDLAVACLIEPTVERTQGEQESISACPRQRRRIRAGSAPGQSAPEAKRRVGADLEKAVERQDDARRMTLQGLDDMQAEQMSAPFDQALRPRFGKGGTER